MKKILLPLLLILAVGMLAAVESEPSEVVGYVKYDCYTGFSYVAIPMGSAGNAEDLVASNMPSISAIYKFIPTLQGWTSIVYDPEFEEWIGSMPVVPGDVLLLKCTANTTFYSIGSLPNNYTYNITNGYNYITVPVNRGNISAAEQIGNEIGDIRSIFRWLNNSQGWESIVYDSEFMEWIGTIPVSIGDVLLLNSSGTAIWPSATKVNNQNILGKK